ncbi:MAG: ABC transporter permease [Chloroflexota bacterium]|nr:MAG: ABC transporter permease [Chloroflexota bacterium]
MTSTSGALPGALLEAEVKGRSPWLDTWARLRQSKTAMAGLVIVVGMFVVAILAPWIAPYPYDRQNLDIAQQGPSLQHWLGTDSLGRDMLSRLIWGARSAAFVSTVPLLISMAIGTFFGAVAGYFGGKIDTLIMRLTDVMFAFPGMLFAILVAATIKPMVQESALRFGQLIGRPELGRSSALDYVVVFIALSLVSWGGMTRLMRGQILSLKERDFVLAAEAMGASGWRVLFRHLLPNTLNIILVVLSMGMAGMIMTESVLSFLGIGIQPPNASWGAMVDEALDSWRSHPQIFFIPGAVIAIMIYAFNFLGDGLYDALNPKGR